MWRSLRKVPSVIGLAVLIIYVASYFVISRLSEREAHDQGIDGFYYVPFSKLDDPRWVQLHYILRIAYRPVHMIDRHLFKGPKETNIPDFYFVASSSNASSIACSRIAALVVSGELTADVYGRACLPPDLAGGIGEEIIYVSRSHRGVVLVLFPSPDSLINEAGKARYAEAELYASEQLGPDDTRFDSDGDRLIDIAGPLVLGPPGGAPERQGTWVVSESRKPNWYNLFDIALWKKWKQPNRAAGPA